jgi:hypothetical protein
MWKRNFLLEEVDILEPNIEADFTIAGVSYLG